MGYYCYHKHYLRQISKYNDRKYVCLHLKNNWYITRHVSRNRLHWPYLAAGKTKNTLKIQIVFIFIIR